MKANLKKLNSSILFIIIILIITILRIVVEANLPSYIFLNSIHDDLLLINYSNLFNHFTNWNYISLVKNLSYSLFLSIVNFSGIPYNIWLGIIWAISGLIVLYGISESITKNKIILIISFIFITFLPIAFSMSTGLRVYRNAIIAPTIIITCMSFFIFINKSLDKIDRQAIIWAIITGLTFSFYYYIKEDSIILLPLFCVMIFSIIVYKLYKMNIKDNYKKTLKVLLILLLPLIIFGLVTVVYEETNEYYFGVSEINTRTNGELGEFWQNLLLIDDDNKNISIWVPYSTIEKAWNNSPTLQAHPDLLNAIQESRWGDYSIVNSTLQGDLVAWSLRDTLYSTDYYSNEQEVQDLFRIVNNELEDSFNNGNLKKSDKIFISNSLPGLDSNNLNHIYPFFICGLDVNMLYKNINLEPLPVTGSSHIMSDNSVIESETVLNQKLLNVDNFTSSQEFSLQFAEIDIGIYQLLAPIIIILSFIGFILLILTEIKTKFKNPKLNLLLIFEIMLFGTFLVQLFAISWFNVWFDSMVSATVFYTVPCQGLIALFEILSIIYGIKIIYGKFKK